MTDNPFEAQRRAEKVERIVSHAVTVHADLKAHGALGEHSTPWGWVRHGGTTHRAGAHESLYFATTRGIKAVRQPSPSSRLKDQPAPQGVKAKLTNPRQGCPAALPPSEVS